jgi:hypothetical protein
VSPYTSRTVFLDFFLYIAVYNLINQNPFPKKPIKILCQFLVIIAVFVSLDSLFQKFLRYDTYFSYLAEHAKEFDPYTLEMLKNRITDLSGRVFSHFLLPAHLAGYLIMIIPLNLALIQLTPILWRRVCWIIPLAINLTVLFFTRSYGGWFSFFSALALVLFYPLLTTYNKLDQPDIPKIGNKQSRWHVLYKSFSIIPSFIFFSAGIFIIFALIGYNRGGDLWDLNSPSHPGYLRFLNWKSTFLIFVDYPWTGSGLGTFKVMYPQYMLPGSNEVNFAHNSYLQIASELGLPGFLAICGGFILWVREGLKKLSILRDRDTRILHQSLFLAGLSFCLHNFVDYSLYVTALGLLGSVILGLTSKVGAEKYEGGAHSHTSRFLLICLAGLSLWLFILNSQIYRTESSIRRIKELMSQGDSQSAYQVTQKALRLDSRNPILKEISGILQLQLKQPEKAIETFKKAIELDPKIPRFHAQLAEAYLLKGDLVGGYIEQRKATELFPLRAFYQKKLEEITLLLEKYSAKKPYGVKN